jgi:hypothetical protein
MLVLAMYLKVRRLGCGTLVILWVEVNQSGSFPQNNIFANAFPNRVPLTVNCGPFKIVSSARAHFRTTKP